MSDVHKAVEERRRLKVVELEALAATRELTDEELVSQLVYRITPQRCRDDQIDSVEFLRLVLERYAEVNRQYGPKAVHDTIYLEGVYDGVQNSLCYLDPPNTAYERMLYRLGYRDGRDCRAAFELSLEQTNILHDAGD